jgi:hypothetical protein
MGCSPVCNSERWMGEQERSSREVAPLAPLPLRLPRWTQPPLARPQLMRPLLWTRSLPWTRSLLWMPPLMRPPHRTH